MNNNQHIPTSTDVLIVGAGPIGMTLAISLRQLGLDGVVIDQQPDPPDDARAAFVQPRTLEYLRRIHVADPMIDDGLKGRGAVFADVERDLIRLSYETVHSPYPFLLMIPQSQTQRRLDQRFAELGGSVLRGVRLLDLVPEFPGSAATVVDSDGAASHRCPLRRRVRWRRLLACAIDWVSVSQAAHRSRCLRWLTLGWRTGRPIGLRPSSHSRRTGC